MNTAPVAVSDSYATDEDTALVVSAANGVLANDADADGDTLSAILVAGPANGTLTLNPDGSFTYTPVADYSGTDSFSYRANDGTVDGNVTTVNLAVRSESAATIIGTEGDDTLTGTDGDDHIQGLGGNDTIDGGAGNDLLEGGAGGDELSGGFGTDTLLGGDGHDFLYDVAGTDDVLRGEAGDDQIYAEGSSRGFLTLDGGTGNDVIGFWGYQPNATVLSVIGGDGSDSVTVYSANEASVDAGIGNDTVNVEDSGAVTVDAGAGDDTVAVRRATTATMLGGAGEDTLRSYGVGTAVINGGDDNDTISVDQNTSTTIDAGAGDDLVFFGFNGGSYDAILGTGQDQVVLGQYQSDGPAAIVIEDFEAGDAGDAFDLSNLLLYSLQGWDQSSNPFEGGFLTLVQSGDDTLLQIDVDGADGQEYSPETLATLSNVEASALTAYNLGGYDASFA